MRDGFRIYSCGAILNLAIRGWERAREGSAEDSLASILFAAASTEGFIAELADTLSIDSQISKREDFAQVAVVLDELEAERMSVIARYRIAKRMLPGESFDAGKQPLQDLNLLHRTRSVVIHPKPTFRGDHTKLFEALRSRCEIRERDERESTIARMMDPSIAKWACEAALLTMTAFRDIVDSESERLNPVKLFLWSRTFDDAADRLGLRIAHRLVEPA